MIQNFPALHRAWPSRFLAMRGVETVSGHICVVEPDEDNPVGVWDGPALCNQGNVDGYVFRGDLFPAVDPARIGTWACLLHNLAQAAFGRPPQGTLLFFRNPQSGLWGLQEWTPEGYGRGEAWEVATDDSAVALVEIRGRLRDSE